MPSSAKNPSRSAAQAVALALALPCALPAATSAEHAPIPVHTLDNGTVRAAVTEAVGGRLLSFSLAGKPNFLLVDEQAGDPDRPVDIKGPHVGYKGHENWIGPQNEWWTHQTVNPERAVAHANWPPDPYLSLARYTLAHKGKTDIAFDSPASPVNGMLLHKSYALVPGKPNSLRLDVAAINTRTAQVAWDIWFNTRAHADTRVYVPVAAKGDVRVAPVTESAVRPPTYTLADRVFSLDVQEPGPDAETRTGKIFIQPSSGWMAGFHSGQVLVIQFPHQPRSAIHPDQGQIELYNDFQPADLSKGLMEMEVHAPYVRLAPGARMKASETWTILPYNGPATRAAHVAFLRAHAKALGLGGL
jgi:hypothetical protein